MKLVIVIVVMAVGSFVLLRCAIVCWLPLLQVQQLKLLSMKLMRKLDRIPEGRLDHLRLDEYKYIRLSGTTNDIFDGRNRKSINSPSTKLSKHQLRAPIEYSFISVATRNVLDSLVLVK